MTRENGKEKCRNVGIFCQHENDDAKDEEEKGIVYEVVRHKGESFLEEDVGNEVDIRQKGKTESKHIEMNIEMTSKEYGDNDIKYCAKRKIFDHGRSRKYPTSRFVSNASFFYSG